MVSTATHPQWSWITVNGSDADQWPRQLDSFQLSVTTRGAQPLSHQSVGYLFIYLLIYLFTHIDKLLLQCFDAVGWAAGRASGL